MKNIALVNLRYKVDISFQRKESLGIAYISSTLKKHGHSVDIIDAQYFNLDIEQLYEKIMAKKYDLIGFSLFEETAQDFELLYNMLIDKVNSVICLGGHFATFKAEFLVKKYPRIDFISMGEGERTILEVVESLEKDEWKKVDGICYMEDDQVIYTDARKMIEDLDQISYPDRDVYFLNNPDRSQMAVTISASRGCYAQCAFCSIQAFYKFLDGKCIRIRQPEKVVEEMEMVYKTYQMKKFFFADDNFFSTDKIMPGWIDRFCDEIERRNLVIKFDIDCRVNDVDKEKFKRLRKVGLNGVFLGIESFSQRMLDTFNKKVKVEDNVNAIMTLHRLRITVWMGFIMFDMFTSLDEIRENVKALEKINYFKYFNYDRPLSSDKLASQLTLYNGTPILKTLQREHPEILHKTKFGYQYSFIHNKTEVFYNWLSKWKAVSREMVRLDTLHYIAEANKLNMDNEVGELNYLSRKYMHLDKDAFLEILDAVDKEQEEKITGIIESYKEEFEKIKTDVLKLEQVVIEAGGAATIEK